jgi:BASS family bile acid:Na+ symporter
MEIFKEILPLVLKGSVLLMVLAVGLDATPRQAAFVIMRPNVLLRSIIAIAVIVPAFAALMVGALPLTRAVKIGILLMAVSPLPPFLPSKDIKLGGRRRYVYGLLVAVSLIAVVLVPLTVAILARVFSAKASIGIGPVLRLILISVLFPLALGMLIRHFAPRQAERAAPTVNKVAGILLVLSVLPLLFQLLPLMLHLFGNGTIVAIVVIVTGALLAGHLLGGPEPQDRAALAIACTTRHPGVALLIAHANLPEPEIKAVILLFVIVGVLVGLPYQLWFKRHQPALP